MSLPTELALHMNGGAGETSYANNSSTPRKVMMRVKPVLEEIINKIYGTTNDTPITCLKVADLGCSCGPNTLLLASNIIRSVHKITTSRRLKADYGPATVQFFLNDLFGNDFNSLFRSLPQFYHNTLVKQGTTCLINATPGTFYGTLFPSNSIHFFHSSFSLQWLSQVPNLSGEEAKIGDDDKGNIYAISLNVPPSYAKQFKHDFKQFLRSRHKELVPEGGMLLTFMGRFETAEYISIPGLFRMALNDMVSENLIEEAKVQTLNVPIYFATLEEVRGIIEEEGSFRLEKLESIKLSWDGSSLNEAGDKGFEDENERAESITRSKRSVFEPLLRAHFGEGIMDELFLRFKNKVIQFLPKLEDPVLVVSLSKIA